MLAAVVALHEVVAVAAPNTAVQVGQGDGVEVVVELDSLEEVLPQRDVAVSTKSTAVVIGISSV